MNGGRLDIILLIRVQSSDYFGAIIEMKKKNYNKLEKVLLGITIFVIVVEVGGSLYEGFFNIMNCGAEKLEYFKIYSQVLIMISIAVVGTWFIIATKRRRNDVLNRKWKLVSHPVNYDTDGNPHPGNRVLHALQHLQLNKDLAVDSYSFNLVLQ